MTLVKAFYEKKLTCIYCGSPFITQRVRSRFAVPYRTDSDFCPHFREGNYNPHYYFVNVCPECGFAFSEDFSDQFPAGSKELINSQIAKHWKKRNFGEERDLQQALESYKLAILAGTLKKEKNAVLAGLCLRLAWLYRTEENTEQERRFLALALRSYEESFVHSDFTDTSMSEIRVLFMIGELSRRMEDYKKAVSYFSKIIQHKDAGDETKIVNLAREQWREAAEELRKEKIKS
ncbi:DUF2225 domain-containing protein [Desulfosporosinus sp.]|uniref:DUF2225 domain-containing protein n=1 Tax=Desulfosporosinus sp. TaxID=157907 RepID=UPI00230E31C1|nr:DUF2225 domain-containing protein [Desulfosporosinus sp.]MCO5384896.1 DUF2225 domain-containing protein [Desulfosporosinus sp.]MDA8222539.1 DUF2225 domain-containing protein [Desulfitobacterium hafniense]